MAQRDLIVSFLSSVPAAIAARFDRKPLFLVSPIGQLPQPEKGWLGGAAGYAQWLSSFKDAHGNLIPGMAREAGALPGDEIGRVCVMGFSNGCQGVEQVLRAPDSAKIDVVIACDGIHAQLHAGLVNPVELKTWMNHAAMVTQGNPDTDFDAPYLIITHSAIRPPFASTTETASVIWQFVSPKAPADALTIGCGYPCAPVERIERMETDTKPIPICDKGKCTTWQGLSDGFYDRRALNNFFVLGWGDPNGQGAIVTKDPRGYNDHVLQAQYVLPALLGEFCVKRWKGACATVAVVSGLGAEGCEVPEGRVYSKSKAQKKDYFPELQPGAITPLVCPPPPPGSVIVGRPGDPCATMPTTTVVPVPERGFGLREVLLAGIGTIVGYAGFALVRRRWRRAAS